MSQFSISLKNRAHMALSFGRSCIVIRWMIFRSNLDNSGALYIDAFNFPFWGIS